MMNSFVAGLFNLDECVKMFFLADFLDHFRKIEVPTEMNYVIKFGLSESDQIHVRSHTGYIKETIIDL